MTAKRTSPYVGLVPFSVDDAEFFFGRAEETGLVVSNLTSSRLTLLYGPSGVGKSSLVDAGVMHRVRTLARERVARLGPMSAAVRAVVEGAGVARVAHLPVAAGLGTQSAPGALRVETPGGIGHQGAPALEDEQRRPPALPPVPVILNAWRDDPTLALAERIGAAVAEVYGVHVRVIVREGASLRELLSAWAERVGADLFVILDQFDEFFLYHPEDQPGAFADQLAEAVCDPGLRANFLLSLREDTLASLDRFKGLIPGLFSNYLRLEYLNSEAARLAITGPIERFNSLVDTDERIRLGDHADPAGNHLVDEVLRQVRPGQGLGDADAESGMAGAPVVAPGAVPEGRVETPYLQLVMARLWKEERERGSDTLRLSTLRELGGAERIVSQHLEEVLGTGPEERETAARLFAHLVTSAGRKIALTVPELSHAAGLSTERISPVVKLLRERSVLRSAGPPTSQPENERTRRYEITHDVLAIAALRWRAEYLRIEGERRAAADAHQIAVERERRRRRWILIAAGATLLVGAGGWLFQRDRQRDERIRAMRTAALAVMVSAVAREQLGPDPTLAAALADTADRLYSNPRSVDVLRQALFGPIVVRTLGGSLEPVVAVAFAADENVFMVHLGGWVQVWNRAGGQVRLGDVEGPVEDAVLLPGGREAALAWGAPGAERLQILPLSPETRDTTRSDNGASWVAREEPGRVLDLATSPDGQWLLSGGLDRGVRAWPRGAGAPRNFCCAQQWGAFSVAMAHRGEYVAAGGGYGQVTLWKWSAPGTPLRSLNLHHDTRVTAVAFHPSDTLLLTAGRDTTVAVWTVPGLRQVLVLRGHTGWVQDAAYNRDGTRIVSASKDGTARVWDAGTGRLLAILQHPAGVRAARFNASGSRIVTAGEDGLAREWEWNDRGLPLAVTTLNLMTPGTIVSGGGIEVGTPTDSTIPEVRDAGGVWRLRQPQPHQGPVRGAVISRDGQVVATGSDDGVYVWNSRTGGLLGGLGGWAEGIAGITFTPDDRLLVATLRDGSTLVLDFGAREIIARGRSGEDPYLLPRGYPWVLALFPGETQVYRCDVCVSPDELRRRFAGRIRPLTRQEQARYLAEDTLTIPP